MLSDIKPLKLSRGSLELTKTVNSLEILEKQVVFGLYELPDKPGIAAQIFEELSKAKINVDLIIQATREENSNDITFTIAEKFLEKTIEQSDLIISQLGGKYSITQNMTKLSIQGAGIMAVSYTHLTLPTTVRV